MLSPRDSTVEEGPVTFTWSLDHGYAPGASPVGVRNLALVVRQNNELGREYTFPVPAESGSETLRLSPGIHLVYLKGEFREFYASNFETHELWQGGTGGSAELTVLDVLERRRVKGYLRRALKNETYHSSVYRKVRSRCKRRNPLVWYCRFALKRSDFRLQGRGYIYYPMSPYAEAFEWRLRTHVKWDCDGPRLCSIRRHEYSTSGFICKLEAIPFIEKRDPVDPSC